MVLKQWVRVPSPTYLFENDVKMYGTQTLTHSDTSHLSFENDVKMYGTQIVHSYIMSRTLFENDVKMYGTQTFRRISANLLCLRMM